MTKQSRFALLPVVLIFLFTTSVQADKTQGTIHKMKPGEIAMQPDSRESFYKIEGYSSYFTQSIQMGGYFRLQIKNVEDDVLIEINDINGIVPIGEEKYVYAISSVYGNRPGLYLFDAKERTEVTLQKAKNVTKGYPNGADYFDLVKYDVEKQVISFYFTPDPNSTDFSKLRTFEYLRKLDLDDVIE